MGEGLTGKLNSAIVGWGTLVIAIVIISLILLQMKAQNVGGSICPSSNVSMTVFNESLNVCHVTGNSSRNESISTLGSSMDSAISSLDEPITWIAIVVIAVIGFAILKLFNKKT